jgi:hypothetical protein
MLSIKFEGILCSVVKSILVGKEIGKDCHLGHNWSILQDFLLKSNVILSQAKINNSVELIVCSALVCLQMIIFAFTSCSSVRVASLWNEALSLSPVVNSGNISAVTVIV